MYVTDTIVALSTPQGAGAIGVVRLSGPDAVGIVSNLFSKKSFAQASANTLHFGKIEHENEVIDEVVLSLFRAPRSYTGENIVEISCHGSDYIIQQIVQQCLDDGARLAEPGEFTQRAFLNRKMDLSQAEAVADLIASESAAEHKMAMHQMRGGFSKEIQELRSRLIRFASLMELELDFGEEDVEFADRSELNALVNKVISLVSGLIDSFKYGNAVKNGVPVAILGKPNAGKSTLLNALLNEERAIVSDIPGTTRDSIEEVAVFQGIKFRFVDTAGLRDTLDSIEAEGVKRSRAAGEKATIIFYLFDSSKEDLVTLKNEILKARQEYGEAKVIAVANKTDLNSDGFSSEDLSDSISISAKERIGIDGLINGLVEMVNNSKATGSTTVVTNARHLQALKKTNEALNRVVGGLDNNIPSDLVAMDIRQALHHLGAITGEIQTDDLLDVIFSEFCIGK